MDNTYKYFLLRGEIIYRGSPVKIPDTFYESAYFTIKCTTKDRQKDGSYKDVDDYFNIHTFQTKKLETIREGYIVSCRVRRDSRPWIKNGEIVKRYKTRMKDGQKINIGYHPVVFEEYKLVGDFRIEDDSVNKEALRETNDAFKDDLFEEK